MTAEDSTMKSELLLTHCIKVEPRQPIHQRNMSISNDDNEMDEAKMHQNDVCMKTKPDFDRVCKNTNQPGTSEDDLEQQVHRLREMVILQLDLIQHQQEQLVKKERQLQMVKQERDRLKSDIERMERHTYRKKINKEDNLDESSSSSDNKHLSLKNMRKSAIVNHSTLNSNKRSLKRGTKGKKRRLFGQSRILHSKCQPISSTSQSASSIADSESSSTDDVDLSVHIKNNNKFGTHREKVRTSSIRHKPDNALRTEDLYYIQPMKAKEEEEPNIVVEQDDVIKVPTWRYHPVHSSYQMEGTENIDDETYYRRHFKLEIDEKRRKRWDIQRIREQCKTEKLRQGRSSGKDAQKNESEEFSSFFPDAKDVLYIEVSDTVPVLAFGHPIPQFHKCDFTLPWFGCDSDNTVDTQLRIKNSDSDNESASETGEET